MATGLDGDSRRSTRPSVPGDPRLLKMGFQKSRIPTWRAGAADSIHEGKEGTSRMEPLVGSNSRGRSDGPNHNASSHKGRPLPSSRRALQSGVAADSARLQGDALTVESQLADRLFQAGEGLRAPNLGSRTLVLVQSSGVVKLNIFQCFFDFISFFSMY